MHPPAQGARLARSGVPVPDARLPPFATIEQWSVRLPAASGYTAGVNYPAGRVTGSTLMRIKVLSQSTTPTLEIVTNWLALLVLLAVGVVWPPV